MAWSTDVLALVDATTELEIATVRRDGSERAWTPVWVVRAGDQVLVRSWHRRDTGWFGDAVRVGRARVRLGPVEAAVVVTDVGVGEGRDAVDDAYRAKYGTGGSTSMVTAEAAATTLRLDPAD